MNNDYSNVKKMLEEMLQKKRQDKMVEDQLRQAKNEGDRNKILENISGDLATSLKPVLADLAKNSKLSTDDIRSALSEAIQFTLPEIKVPDITIPPINVPEPKVTVNFDASKIRVTVPEIKVPEVVIPSNLTTTLKGVDNKNPLPVMMMGTDGKPLGFPGSSGGGKTDFLTIKAFGASAFSEYQDGDGRLKVSVPTGASGLTDTELRASSLPVEQVSGSIWSTYVTGSFSSTQTNDLVNADNRLRVSVETGGSGLTDAEIRASSLPVEQVSGSIWSTYVTGSSGSLAASIVDSSGVQYSGSNPVPVAIVSGSTATSASNIVDSTGVAYTGSNPVPVTLISGALSSTGAYLLNGDGTYRDSMPVTGTFYQATQPVSGTVAVSGLTGSIGATILNGEGVARDTWGSSQVGTWNIGTVTTVTGVTNSLAANVIDSSGVAYSTSNPFPVRGDVVSGTADSGTAPVKVAGQARTTNPTAQSDADVMTMSTDDLGRTLTRPIQVRDLIATAYASFATGTEATLFAGATSTYHDLIYVLASNNSTAAVGIDIRGSVAGNILMHLEIPANATTGLSLPVPLPAGDVGATWTVDLPDVTGTTVYVSALFSKEV